MRSRFALLISFALLTACGKDSPPEPLDFVPADTPYVVANRVATPAAVSEAWMKLSASGHVERDMQRIVDALKPDDADDAVSADAEDVAMRRALLKWLPALTPELVRFETRAGIEELGMTLEGRYAIYGHGLLPVMRLELGDPARFAATVARIEQRAGETLATRRFGEASFWQVSAGKVELLFGSVDGQLVVTLGPGGQSDAAWQQQLGLQRPAQSLKASGALEALDQQQRYTGHGSGWIDIRSLVRRLSGRDAGDAAVFAAFGLPVPAPSASCIAEYDALAGRMPRMHFGFTRMLDREMSLAMVWELDATLQQALASLPAPIPGPGAGGEGMLRFGLSIDAQALMRELGVMARTINGAPFACEELQPVNQMASELDAGLKNPALGMAGAVHSLQFALDAVKLGEAATPEQLDAVLAVGGAMPPMLWSMVQSGLPSLAGVQLAPDGKAVTLPEGVWPLSIPLQALMTSGGLALASGSLSEARLLAEATPPTERNGTLMYYGLTGSALTQMGSAMRQMGAGQAEATPEIAETADLLEQMGAELSSIRVELRTDPAGLRMEQEARLN